MGRLGTSNTIGNGAGNAIVQAGLAQTLQAKLKYVTTNQPITFAAGVPTPRQYALNGLFDPDITGVGHQPYLFDQLCNNINGLNYQRYLVEKVSITLLPEEKGTGNANSVYYTIEVNQGGASVPNQCDNALERAWKWCKPTRTFATGVLMANTGDRFIKATATIPSLLGRPFDIVVDSGSGAANPTQPLILNVYAWNSDNSATVTESFTLIIKYWVKFYNPVPVGES